MVRKTNPGTLAVQEYRERAAKAGAEVLYSMIDKTTAKALDAIMQRRIATKREAVQWALQRGAAELARKR